MNKRLILTGVLICMAGTPDGFGKNSKAVNVQKSSIANEEAHEEDAGEEMNNKNDYRDNILSNPETNAAARAGLIVGGGNTAIINQNGSQNSSSIIQSGDDNMATQNQTGIDNDLYLEQSGNRNRHKETQKGSHNRKVIIQHDSETIIEQVTPEDVK